MSSDFDQSFIDRNIEEIEENESGLGKVIKVCRLDVFRLWDLLQKLKLEALSGHKRGVHGTVVRYYFAGPVSYYVFILVWLSFSLSFRNTGFFLGVCYKCHCILQFIHQRT